MNNATSMQIRGTLSNMRAEVQANGVTEVACEMWDHALTMYRKSKGHAPRPVGFNVFDPTLPAFLRRQAD
jgi:hypothetical protein